MLEALVRCEGVDWTVVDLIHLDEYVGMDNTHGASFAKYLKEEANYTVGMFGKYLNNVPKFVPPGFDAWLANGGGSYLSPEFATWNIDGLPNGTWKVCVSCSQPYHLLV